MWTQDSFPGADKVPWQLLIRARYQDEIDAVVAHSVLVGLAPLLSREKAYRLGEMAAEVTRRDGSKRLELEPTQKLAALDSFVEWDGEICPPWPWPIPWPPAPWPPVPFRFDDFDDPALSLAVDAAHSLLRGAASEQVRERFREVIGKERFDN